MHDSDVAGITTANSCRDVQCQNGGACITAGSQNVQCSCQRGYRSTYCEHRVPSCQHFGNSAASYGSFYYMEDSYEGSLMVWFCARRSHPEFGYSVCEDRFSRHLWSNHPKCKSRAQSLTDFEDVTPLARCHSLARCHPWPYYGGPAVIVILIMSLLTPLFIYYIVYFNCRECRNEKNAKDDGTENSAIAEKYMTKLEILENRSPLPLNADMIRALYQIQQQLKEEFNQLLSRRQQRDRKVTKIKFCRVYSFCMYISSLIGMIYLGANFGQYPTVFKVLDIFVIIPLIIMAILLLKESRQSSELQYIKNLSTPTSVTERIESFRNEKPTINMHAKCYSVDSDGVAVSAHIVEPFQFTHWFDSSQRTLTDIHRSRVTRIKMELSVQFGDEATAQCFAEKCQQFQDENRYRDDRVKFFISYEMDGPKERLAVYDDSGKPPWMSSGWFWLATLFGLGWPYRIMFNHTTSKTKYSIVKVIFSSAPTPSSNFTSESTEIDNILKNIQGMLDLLNVNALLMYHRETPVICIAENEHMDSPL